MNLNSNFQYLKILIYLFLFLITTLKTYSSTLIDGDTSIYNIFKSPFNNKKINVYTVLEGCSNDTLDISLINPVYDFDRKILYYSYVEVDKIKGDERSNLKEVKITDGLYKKYALGNDVFTVGDKAKERNSTFILGLSNNGESMYTVKLENTSKTMVKGGIHIYAHIYLEGLDQWGDNPVLKFKDDAFDERAFKGYFTVTMGDADTPKEWVLISKNHNFSPSTDIFIYMNDIYSNHDKLILIPSESEHINTREDDEFAGNLYFANNSTRYLFFTRADTESGVASVYYSYLDIKTKKWVKATPLDAKINDTKFTAYFRMFSEREGIYSSFDGKCSQIKSFYLEDIGDFSR